MYVDIIVQYHRDRHKYSDISNIRKEEYNLIYSIKLLSKTLIERKTIIIAQFKECDHVTETFTQHDALKISSISEQTPMETKVQRILPPLGFGIPSLLPPCVVCGEKGSGLHYGVNTCNSCKVRQSGLLCDVCHMEMLWEGTRMNVVPPL